MSAVIISGTEISQQIINEIQQEVTSIQKNHHTVPGLATILVGDNPASKSYVNLKIKTAMRLGFKEIQNTQDKNIKESHLLEIIQHYNLDDSIHGILVQLPLPRHVSENKVIQAIAPDKDVDGFHPLNVGRMLLGQGPVTFRPCTPAAIQELIKRSKITTQGAEVVVVGRSNIVGRPIANMLSQRGETANATVTMVHTGTKNLAKHCQRADILIVAAGVPGLVKPEWIKPGACVIDVGVNQVGEKISERTGKKVAVLKGDVDFEAAKEIAGHITPVPGGVGPMTIAMLMNNTLKSLKLRLKEKK